MDNNIINEMEGINKTKMSKPELSKVVNGIFFKCLKQFQFFMYRLRGKKNLNRWAVEWDRLRNLSRE
jgi:hypothetical protein